MNNTTLSAPFESLLPPDMALAAQQAGIAKARTGITKTLMLSILAGAFIAFGAVFYTLAISGSATPYGLVRLLGGLAFSLGLILVVIGGAELFTGNNLLVIAWASRKVSFSQVLGNWILVYSGNMLGAFSIAILILYSGHYLADNGSVGKSMLNIAAAKCQLGFTQAIVLGVLCNILVCLAIWLCYSTRSSQGRILALIFPITAFVAAGFEHSVANMYFIPMGLLLKQHGNPVFWEMIQSSPAQFELVSFSRYFAGNLLPVTIGNIIGGAVFVGLAYWFIYLRNFEKAKPSGLKVEGN